MQYFVLCYLVEKRPNVGSFTLYLAEMDFFCLGEMCIFFVHFARKYSMGWAVAAKLTFL